MLADREEDGVWHETPTRSLLTEHQFWHGLNKARKWRRFAMIQWYDQLGSKKEREKVRG